VYICTVSVCLFWISQLQFPILRFYLPESNNLFNYIFKLNPPVIKRGNWKSTIQFDDFPSLNPPFIDYFPVSHGWWHHGGCQTLRPISRHMGMTQYPFIYIPYLVEVHTHLPAILALSRLLLLRPANIPSSCDPVGIDGFQRIGIVFW
jgi:hypothetical protein